MRVRRWDLELVRFARRVAGAPFVWGETDCASLVRRAAEAMYPPERVPLPADLPSWTTRTGALRAHKSTGGTEAALRRSGAREVPLNFCRQGDVLIGLDPQGGLPGAAVAVERHYLVASEEEGVLRRRLRDLRAEKPDDVSVLRLPDE